MVREWKRGGAPSNTRFRLVTSLYKSLTFRNVSTVTAPNFKLRFFKFLFAFYK